MLVGMVKSIPEGKKFLSNVTIAQLRSLQKKEKSERYKRHFTAAIKRKEGQSMREIADDVNMSVASIKIWFQNMMERGVTDNYKISQGRPPKFTLEQLDELSADMKKLPSEYGLNYDSWTSEAVTKHVSRRFNISITPGSMRRILVRKDVDWPGSAKAKRQRREEEARMA